METIHILGFLGALLSLYFCTVLMSSNRSTHMAYQLSSFFFVACGRPTGLPVRVVQDPQSMRSGGSLR
jgi:hypothetical protein